MKRLLFSLVLAGIFAATSCMIITPAPAHDNGKHKGWYKNPNNPHNPAHGTATNASPGNGNGNGNGNAKKKK